jgi:hypothetical protein
VQKAGTSTLYALLAAHAHVAPSGTKELHYFDNDRLDWAEPDHEAYNRRFRWTDTALIAGEATPRYLHWPGAMERIREYNPAMRLILVFRDPIERAFSHWTMVKDRKPEVPGFAEAIRAAWATEWSRTAVNATRRTERTIVSRGFYGQQLEHALTLFEPSQLLVLDYHRVFPELPDHLDRIAEFLGVGRFDEVAMDLHRRPTPRDLVTEPPTGVELAKLAGVYANDLDRFAHVSGLDVSAWPTHRILSGTLDPSELAATLAAKARLIPPSPA